MVTKGLLAAVLALTGVAASAGSIASSKHDFSAVTGTNGQICIACHAPHNTAAGLTALWNHALSEQTYTMYNTAFSSTATGTVDAQPGATSKLCLSCHDGTVAVNSFGGVTGAVAIAASSNLGTSLTNDHPISVIYNTALVDADGALFEPSTRAANIGTGGTKSRTGTIATNLLFNTKVECASCHDVHNTFTVPLATSGTGLVSNKLVKISMVGSALCLTCHDK
jgi:hypothetical protein